MQIDTSNLSQYFEKSLIRVNKELDLSLSNQALIYVNKMLNRFMNVSALFEQTENDGLQQKLLAYQFFDAADKKGEARHQVLQNIGDQSLFVSSVFPGIFRKRKSVLSISYYIDMGVAAYGTIADHAKITYGKNPRTDLYSELAKEFGAVIFAVRGVTGAMNSMPHEDLLQMHEILMRTGNIHAEKVFRDKTDAIILPMQSNKLD